MTTAGTVRPQVVAGEEILPGLEAALADGPPVAPVPAESTDRLLAIQTIQPSEPVPERDIAAIVTTSGSTGTGKAVLLSRRAVRAAVESTHRRLGGPGSWALALPGHYVAGLMVMARCLVAGTTVHPAASDLHDLAEVAGRMSGLRYLSVVPTQLTRALADPDRTSTLACFDAVLVGGSAIDEPTLSRARDAGIRIVTTYGMSETCGGCVYDGIPLDCTKVAIEATTDRILLTGPMAFSGYRLRADLTAGTLRGQTVRTADRGRLNGGRLVVAGRTDEVVVSGGLNVDLAEVERACREWVGGQGEIAVLGLPDPEWGVRVTAVTNCPGMLADLRSFLQARLPAYAAPRDLVRVDALPHTPTGKIDRQRLRRRLAPDPGAETKEYSSGH